MTPKKQIQQQSILYDKTVKVGTKPRRSLMWKNLENIKL